MSEKTKEEEEKEEGGKRIRGVAANSIISDEFSVVPSHVEVTASDALESSMSSEMAIGDPPTEEEIEEVLARNTKKEKGRGETP